MASNKQRNCLSDALRPIGRSMTVFVSGTVKAAPLGKPQRASVARANDQASSLRASIAGWAEPALADAERTNEPKAASNTTPWDRAPMNGGKWITVPSNWMLRQLRALSPYLPLLESAPLPLAWPDDRLRIFFRASLRLLSGNLFPAMPSPACG